MKKIFVILLVSAFTNLHSQVNSRSYVGHVTDHTLNGIVIDNFYFGVASLGKNDHESLAVFPNSVFRD